MPEPAFFFHGVCTATRNFIRSGKSVSGVRRVLLSRMHCNVEFYYVGKIPRTGIGRLSKQGRVVLRRRNTVVGGKCALPSALLHCVSKKVHPSAFRNN